MEQQHLSRITPPGTLHTPTQSAVGRSSFRDVVAAGFRHGRLALLAFVAVVAAALVVIIITSAHESEMKILVKKGRVDPLVSAQPTAAIQPFRSDSPTEEEVNSEVELLTSRDLLREVVLDLKLDAKSTSMFDRFRDPQYTKELRVERAINKLNDHLKIAPVEKTDIISVRYRSRDPQQVVDVLRTMQDKYLQKHLQVHRAPGQFDFYQRQAEAYASQLADTEKKLASFDGGPNSVSPVGEADLKLSKMTDFEAQLKTTRATIGETKGRIEQLRRQVAQGEEWRTTEVKTINSAQVEHLRATLLDLELKRTEMLTRYAPTYKPVQEIDTKIQQTKAALQTAESNPPKDEVTQRDSTKEWARNELAKAEADLQTLRGREAGLLVQLAAYRNENLDLNKKKIAQGDLTRMQKVQEDNYLLYARKREEARITDAMDQQRIANVAIAQPPTLDDSKTKSPLALAIVSILLAAMVSFGAVMGAELMDDTFRTPSELSSSLNLPVLAAVPAGNTHLLDSERPA